MKAMVGVILTGVLAFAVGGLFFKTASAGSGGHQVSAYLEQLAAQVTEIEDKLNGLIAHQIKSSENNREVYGAVARLCTIFEGILRINRDVPEPAGEGNKEGG